MPLTQFAKTAIINHGFKQIAYSPANSTVWLAFFTSVTGLETGTLTNESSDMGRTIIPFSASSSVTERAVLNSTAFSVTATTGGEILTHWGIVDSASAGNLLLYGPLDSGITTTASGDVDIEIASIGTQWDQAELQCLTKYFIDEMMDLMFADPGTAFPAPAATYVSLHTATSFTGANEFTDPAYSRQLPTLGSTAIVSGNARVTTTSDITWADQVDTPGAQWAVWDASTAGNCLAFFDCPDVALQQDFILPSGAYIEV